MAQNLPASVFNEATGRLNATAILLVLNGLSDGERRNLFSQFGVADEDGLIAKYNPALSGVEDSLERQLMQHDEYKLHKLLLLYVPPILLIVGTVGNLFSFVVLMMPAMRRVSTYLYVAALSVTDTLVLFVGLLRLWVAELQGYDIMDRAAWTCKTINVLGYTVSDYSVWLIIAMTVERYVAVCHPLRAVAVCNRSRAVKVMLVLFGLMLALNLHFFWTTQIRQFQHGGESIQQCDGAEGYHTLVVLVWPWVDAAVYSFLPFIIIMFLNVRIIRRVLAARCRRRNLSQPPECLPTSPSSSTRRSSGDTNSRLTVMLLCISFTFLAMTLPVNIVLIATGFWNVSDIDVDRAAKFKLVRTITELLMYANHSSNFFLYCATGQKFRRQICLLLCRRWRHPDALVAFGSTYKGTQVRNSRFSNSDNDCKDVSPVWPSPKICEYELMKKKKTTSLSNSH